MSYGHGMSVNLMQMANAYQVFARDGDIVPCPCPAWIRRRCMAPGVLAADRPGSPPDARMVVQPGGTAQQANVPGYRVGGKTGTAMKLVGGHYANRYVASFVGIAPISDPRLIVAVMIDEPSNGKHYGGDVAAPVFAQVTGGALRTLGVAPDAPLSPLQVARQGPPHRSGRPCEHDATAASPGVLAHLAAEGVEVRRLCVDSRQVLAGDVFWPVRAIGSMGGASSSMPSMPAPPPCCGERAGHVWDDSPAGAQHPIDGLASLAGHLAHEVYGRPSEALWLVGVTGTNGKTSVTQWLSCAFMALGRKCGVIGTLGIGFPGRPVVQPQHHPRQPHPAPHLAEFRAGEGRRGGDGGLVHRPRPGRLNGAALRRGGADQPHPRPPRLPRQHGELRAAKARLFDMPGLRGRGAQPRRPLRHVEQARRLAGRGLQVIGYTSTPPTPRWRRSIA